MTDVDVIFARVALVVQPITITKIERTTQVCLEQTRRNATRRKSTCGLQASHMANKAISFGLWDAIFVKVRNNYLQFKPISKQYIVQHGIERIYNHSLSASITSYRKASNVPTI